MNRKVILAAPRSGKDIDEIMLRIVKKTQPQVLARPSAFDVEVFFECDLPEITGVVSDYRELPHGLDGFTDSDKMITVVAKDLVESDDVVTRRRGRATIGHEGSHVLIHIPEFRLRKSILRSIHESTNDNLRFHREENVPTYRNPEWQAWRGAKALLMPAPAVQIAVDRGCNLPDLVKIFDANPAFVRSRLTELGLLQKVKTL